MTAASISVERLTPEEAAEHVPQSAEWIRTQLRAGNLEGSKVGGRWVTTLEAIDALVQRGSNSTRRRRQRRIKTENA